MGVALNVPDTISPRLEEEFPLDFLGYIKGLKTHSPDSLKREFESTKLSLALILLNNSKHTKSCHRQELQESVQMFSLISFLRESGELTETWKYFATISLLVVQGRN